jgi:hypothetical protein
VQSRLRPAAGTCGTNDQSISEIGMAAGQALVV